VLHAIEENDAEEMSEKAKIELFDAYLSGEMTSAEKTAFEDSISEDAKLKEEFEAYQSTSNDIRSGEEYRQIKAKMAAIHDENFSKSKPLILRPRVWGPLLAAAVITVLVLVIPLNNESGNMTGNNEDFQELSNHENSADTTLSDSTLDETDSLSGPIYKELTYIHGEPRGTCFLISNKGYFLTNKHLVRNKKYVRIQQADLDIAFNAAIVYRDSMIDLAILKCSEMNADKMKSVPFQFYRGEPTIGDEVFTLGYPKSDIVYTKGDVSSETGFQSDSMSYEISMASNKGNSGAPLFSKRGDLIGIIMANNSRKQSVTYIVKPNYIKERLANLKDSLDVDMTRNYTKRYSDRSDLIKKYRPFIFEVH
jgi:serine protease Do